MKVTVNGKKIILRDSFKDLCEKKLNKIGRFFDENAEAFVYVKLQKDVETVELTVKDDGLIFRSESATGSMEESLDNAVNAMVRQIHKNKTKVSRRLRGGASLDDLISVASEPVDVEEEEQEFNIVRTKRFTVKPTTVDEAIFQMNMLGHQFYIFQNADTDAINVVYRRKDGDYGLIEPEKD